MRRTTLGILSLVLLLVGLIAVFRGPADGSASGFAGGCIRVGIVLGALWLALPQITTSMGNLRNWALSWVVRKRKEPTSPSEAAHSSNAPPRPPTRRPRRRSTSN